MRDRGQYVPLPSPEAAAAIAVSEPERARMARLRERALSGTAADVAAGIRALAAELGVQELAITTTAYDPQARRKSYALLADALQLDGAGRAA